MNGPRVAGLILVVVGLLNIAYGIYRSVALDASMLPIAPVGLLCAAVGLMLMKRSSAR